MKHLLITSMIALSVSCGAAMAQTQSAQPSGGDNNCGGRHGRLPERRQGRRAGPGETKSKTEMNAQGKAGANTQEQAQCKRQNEDR
ncbi:hypothetical protein ACVOMV_32270 [Mesorhizobium atlanticum]